MTPRTIIVGAAGQDGQLLAQRFRAQGRPILEITRTSLDVQSPVLAASAVRSFEPDEIYYLAGVHEPLLWRGQAPFLAHYQRSHAVHVEGLLHFLEAMRLHRPSSRLIYAGSCHVFSGQPAPQDESTPLTPSSIHGITKAAGTQLCRLYRQSQNIHAAVAILYPHESPLRRADALSRTIVRAAADASRQKPQVLTLADLDTPVDWGYAPDFADALIRIACMDQPDDFLVATGQGHSIREFVSIAYSHLGLDWERYVQIDPAPSPSPTPLIGNASKLRQLANWRPSASFDWMVRLLVDAEVRRQTSQPPR